MLPTFSRSQFPLLPACVLTGRMAQGHSLSAVLLEAGRAPHEGPHAYWISFYVGVSRAPSLDRLLLLGEPDWEALRAGPPPELVEEIERLAGLAAVTSAQFARAAAERSGALPEGVPPAATAPTPLDADTVLADVPDEATIAQLSVEQLRARLRRRPFGATAFAYAPARFNALVAAAPRARLVGLFAALRLAPPPQSITPPRHVVSAPRLAPAAAVPPAARRRRTRSASPPVGSTDAELERFLRSPLDLSVARRRARSASAPAGAAPPPARRRR